MPLVQPPQQATSSPSVTPGVKQLPTLKPCPRPNFVAGLGDWHQITAPRPFPNFDICPDCYSNSFRNTHYGPFISAVPPREENISTRCDFSDLWCRIAYAWLYMQNAPDLTLLGTTAEVPHDEDGACPNLNLEDEEVQRGGKPAATRTWLCLYDPKTNTLVEDLTACSDCVAHINTIFPCLRGIFRPVGSGQKLLATCDLMMLGDGQVRTLEYLDQIISAAEQTLSTGHLTTGPLVNYIQKWASIPFCKKSGTATGEKQYALPTLIPEFTACEECYHKHLKPLTTASPAPHLLSRLTMTVPSAGGFACDLYSARLQQYLQEVCTTNDIATYRQRLQARNAKQQELEMQLVRMKQEYQQLKAQAELHMSMMQMESMSAMNSSLAYTVGGWSAPPIDWRASNAQMSQGAQMNVKAAMVLDNMRLLEKEWVDYWE